MPDHTLVQANESLVKQFLADLNGGAKSFRYFQKRPVEIINQHLCTLMYVDSNNYPVAYGHLDQENGTLWLGIAVADQYTGQGLGKQMMNELINAAREKKQNEITLSVDTNNTRALRLYQTLGFKVISNTGKVNILKMQLS